MVAVDNTHLSLLLHPEAKPPTDPSTNAPVDRMKDRIDQLISDLAERKETILIPTPALSEFLVLAGGSGPDYLDEIHRSTLFRVAPFDERAAVELAEMTREARAGGSKRGGSESAWAKVNFDRQIVAIARVNEATHIYSDDEDVGRFARKSGLEVVRSWELRLPPAKQINMDYEKAPGETKDKGGSDTGPAEV